LTLSDAYKEYRPYLLRRARSRLRVDDAEDAVQQVYLAWLSTGEEIHSPLRYLNRCLTFITYAYHRSYRNGSLVLFERLADPVDHIERVVDRMAATEYMQSLTPRLREARTLKTLGFNAQATAAIMGLSSPEVVRQYWHRSSAL
jgi:DNA-directed RNA polymerase specialized sigma24 family protein